MMITLGPYASFIVMSYAAAALVVMILIGWVMLDYRSQTARLRELDRSGVTRRSGRSATDRS
ncbi:heme exporter protein CcmD [Bradyrhizobium sp. 137]|uniref:heme exporter protein CcmD n=1 Tax=Bradyrhizobium sp. 137 TaxID=2782614 RepID=UPI001FF87E38|nr:heme exporter protein CcmD [Bradyrhizobium sp. 137]